MRKANRLLNKVYFFSSELKSSKNLLGQPEYVFDNDHYRIIIRVDNKRYRIEVHDNHTLFNKYYNYLIKNSQDLTMYLKSLTI